MFKKLLAVSVLGSAMLLSGCQRDAQVASSNLSKAADMFEVNRRVVFYNGITGGYILTVEGLCSIDDG
ncbi:membrane lipoprotein [Vibrio phage 1.250.O._10N.261.55.E11]|nr:membrane lipoprotein [Vibrio phage 1.250.O._10N.261.55.E11]